MDVAERADQVSRTNTPTRKRDRGPVPTASHSGVTARQATTGAGQRIKQHSSSTMADQLVRATSEMRAGERAGRKLPAKRNRECGLADGWIAGEERVGALPRALLRGVGAKMAVCCQGCISVQCRGPKTSPQEASGMTRSCHRGRPCRCARAGGGDWRGGKRGKEQGRLLRR